MGHRSCAVCFSLLSKSPQPKSYSYIYYFGPTLPLDLRSVYVGATSRSTCPRPGCYFITFVRYRHQRRKDANSQLCHALRSRGMILFDWDYPNFFFFFCLVHRVYPISNGLVVPWSWNRSQLPFPFHSIKHHSANQIG